MRLRPNLHDLYVGRVVLATVLLTWAVLVGLDVVMALSNEVSDIGKGNYSFGHAVAWVAYTVPRRAYTMFPTAAVIGALMGLGQLAASSELTALRALGLSRRRLSISVAAALGLLTALMVFSGETLGPWGQSQADVLKNSARSGDVAVDRFYGLWAREGNTFMYAQSGEEREESGRNWLQLHDVRLYELAPDGRLASIAHAATAEHLDGHWLLKNVRRTTFHARSVTQQQVLGERWESKLDAAVLSSGLTKARNLPTRELGQNIDYRKRNGLDAREYEDLYWSRWFYPLNVLALCLAAIPFAFGSLRSGGMGKRLFLGIIFAVSFWALQLQFVRLASAFHLDFRIAYAMPPILLLAVSAWMFRRRSA
ncbi:LPS export ABC transporter permease LptG [Pseudoxanthomonas sp.]|uniref:LPS export ABC transporter permease LptG n=1 Tax=Pseudoxanthomonas sp. TaxID=1871049 RepID=UPI003F822BB1